MNATNKSAKPATPPANIERISGDANGDNWKCVCGNQCHMDGFFPCDARGNEVEPTIGGPWNGVSCVCTRCGRIIDQNTLEVTGRRIEAGAAAVKA